MKKYRLKEEVKKYFSLSMYGLERGKAYWIADGISIEALEEVEERVEVYLHDDIEYNWAISLHGRSFTEQEREDIEKFINVFGSWEKMGHLAIDWEADGSSNGFVTWLKEKGYDN